MKKWFIKMAGDKPRKRSASAGTQPVAKWNRRMEEVGKEAERGV